VSAGDAPEEPRDIRRARRALEQGHVESALGLAWRIAGRAAPRGDEATLGLLAPLAGEIERQADDGSRAEAARLNVFVSRCLDDVRAGVPHSSPFSFVFGRPGEVRLKTCPECAETVRREARVCRYCGHRFEPPLAAGS